MIWAGYLRVTHPFATDSSKKQAFSIPPFDLHVLGMPPAFILSQDQTLHCLYPFRLFAFALSFFFDVFVIYSRFCSVFNVLFRLFRRLIYPTLFRAFCQSFFRLFFASAPRLCLPLLSALLIYHISPLLVKPFFIFFNFF